MIHGLPADSHSSTASSRLNWLPLRFKWTCPFLGKTKSGFCACAITFQTCSTARYQIILNKTGNVRVTIIEAIYCNHCCSGKAISITYSECVCSLSCQARNAHAPYCRQWPAPALKNFSTLSHKRHDFQKYVTEYKICLLIFSTKFVWNISCCKKKWVRYDQKIYIGFHVKYPNVILVRF